MFSQLIFMGGLLNLKIRPFFAEGRSLDCLPLFICSLFLLITDFNRCSTNHFVWYLSFDFEYLNINFISLVGNIIKEESIGTERVQIIQGLDVFFKTEMIQNCIDFDTVFNHYYIPMIRKDNPVIKADR
jgi:hypothetical protein